MFSTLNRYLSREFTLTFIAVSAFLLVVIVGNSFISLLARVMDGKLPADMMISMLGFGVFRSAILLIPFALLVTAMLVLGRLYRDSEIYAIKASGAGTLDLVRRTSLLVLPLIAISFYLSMFSAPWISQQIETIKLKAKGQASVYSLMPGRFVESKQGNWVIFIEDADREAGTVKNIFIYSRQTDKIAIETAQTARQENWSALGGESLILGQGQRYEGVPGEGGFTLFSFDQHALRIPEFDLGLDHNDPEFMKVFDLIKSNRSAENAELQWRLSAPISAILLVLLAFPLSISSPRQGRFVRLALVIAIYLVYSNSLVLAKSWVAGGELPAVPGLFVVHIPLAALVAFLAYRKRYAV